MRFAHTVMEEHLLGLYKPGKLSRMSPGSLADWPLEEQPGLFELLGGIEAAIGVRLKRWVSFHGIAINICNDLGIFAAIVPCGLEGVVMTSLEKETGKIEDMRKIKAEFGLILSDFFRSRP